MTEFFSIFSGLRWTSIYFLESGYLANPVHAVLITVLLTVFYVFIIFIYPFSKIASIKDDTLEIKKSTIKIVSSIAIIIVGLFLSIMVFLTSSEYGPKKEFIDELKQGNPNIREKCKFLTWDLSEELPCHMLAVIVNKDRAVCDEKYRIKEGQEETVQGWEEDIQKTQSWGDMFQTPSLEESIQTNSECKRMTTMSYEELKNYKCDPFLVGCNFALGIYFQDIARCKKEMKFWEKACISMII